MTINIQPIEKKTLSTKGVVQVHSIFHTLQGEGPFAGQPAVFVRLAGCNLQCPACDTEYTAQRIGMAPSTVLDYIEEQSPVSAPTPLIVITGGEPFRQDIAPLVHTLLDNNYRVQIETNGTLYRDMLFSSPKLFVVCSPKTTKLSMELIPHIRAFKYVVKAGDISLDDGLPIHALDHPVGGNTGGRVARPPPFFRTDRIYVQPIDTADADANESHLQAAVKSCMKFGYTLCLQMHKIANLA